MKLLLYPCKSMALWHSYIHAGRCESVVMAKFSRCYTSLFLYPNDKLTVHYANAQHNKLIRCERVYTRAITQEYAHVLF